MRSLIAAPAALLTQVERKPRHDQDQHRQNTKKKKKDTKRNQAEQTKAAGLEPPGGVSTERQERMRPWDVDPAHAWGQW